MKPRLPLKAAADPLTSVGATRLQRPPPTYTPTSPLHRLAISAEVQPLCGSDRFSQQQQQQQQGLMSGLLRGWGRGFA